MKIKDVAAYNLTIPYPGEVRPAWQPGFVTTTHNFTLVKITTDQGVVGYGGTCGHIAATVRASIKPYLVGENPLATERLARIFRHAGGIWCIDMALWDIVGKVAGLPLHRLWGSFRDQVPAYASTVEVGTPENRAELALHYRSLGFKAMKIRLRRDTVEQDLALVDACLKATDGTMDFMVDANQATNLPSPDPGPFWGYQRAYLMARELHQRGILWLEEPLPRFDYDNLVRLREATEIKTAGGEKNQGLHEFRMMIERKVYDIIQPDAAMSEGVSQLRKVAAMCEMCNLEFIPHHGMSGLGLSAQLHLACSVTNDTWLEVIYEPTTRTVECYQQLGGIITSKVWIDKDGFVTPPEAPGLGVEIDESRISDYEV